MRSDKRIIAAAFIVLLTAPTTRSQDGLALMKVEAGARPSGMAGAFVAVAGDPNASFYNPAGAAGTDRFTASFGHNTHWENIRIETAYFASNFTGRSWIHGGIRYAAVNDIESRLAPTTEPDAYFDAHDISMKAGLAYRLAERLAVGAALGWFIEKIDIYRGSAFNVDLGALYDVTPELSLGASATNLGSDFSLGISGRPGTEKVSLPATYRVGAVYRYDRYLGAADLVVLNDQSHLHVGAEGRLHEYLSLRAGYMFNYDSRNFTAGASFTHRKITVDYAFVPYSNELGTSHLFNLTVTL